MQRRTKLRAAKSAVILLAIPFIIYAYEYGSDAGVAGVPGEAGTCNQTGCHTGTPVNGGGGSVNVTFPNGLVYTPGVTQQLTVTITDPTRKRWGFELTARRQSSLETMAGSFSPTDSHTQLICDTFADLGIWVKEQNQPHACPASLPLGYIEQTLAGYDFNQPSPGSYKFNWNPPATDVGPVTIYVAGNAGQGNLSTAIGDHTYTANYALTTACNYSLSSTSNLTIPPGGGAQPTVNVLAGPGCRWTAVANDPWITVTFGQSGTGNGSFGYSVDPNSGPSRTGTITAAGLTFTVMQAGCTFTFVPASATIPSVGGHFSFTVQTGSCTWNATTSTSWIAIDSGSGGPGSGAVTYTVAANPAATIRSGSIAVGGQQFPVTQSAAPCAIALAPPKVTVPAGGASASFNVTATPGCAWTAVSAYPWITVTSGSSGTGNGTVGYTVSPNSGSERPGAIRVNDQSFQITQAGAPCPYMVIPDQTNFSAQGGASAISLETAAGCAWTATASATWMTIQGAASGSGPARISFTVAQNSGSQRTGTLAIAGQTATVEQAGIAPSPVTLTAIKNAASNQQGPVSPGEIVTLIGDILGPATLVQYDAGASKVATILAGTRILFDGVPAPMIYAWSSQSSAIVPFGVNSATGTRVQVEYQGAISNVLTIDVAPSTPAIFSQDSTGQGQGAVLNQDYSLNGDGNPASPGSVVQIFATGGGQTDPPGLDGVKIGAPPPQLSQPVRVWIAGEEAQLQYAGTAPELVAGFVQVNAYVPQDLPPGPAAIVIRIGAAQTPTGITIAIGLGP